MLASKNLLFHPAPCLSCRTIHVVSVEPGPEFVFVNRDREEICRRTTGMDSGGVLKLDCPNCGAPEVVIQTARVIVFIADRAFERSTPFGASDLRN